MFHQYSGKFVNIDIFLNKVEVEVEAKVYTVSMFSVQIHNLLKYIEFILQWVWKILGREMILKITVQGSNFDQCTGAILMFLLKLKLPSHPIIWIKKPLYNLMFSYMFLVCLSVCNHCPPIQRNSNTAVSQLRQVFYHRCRCILVL